MIDRPTTVEVGHEQLRVALAGQYRAMLVMLEEAVRRCPEDEWTRSTPDNTFWQVAYHVLYYTHLYLAPNVEAFEPWPGHQGEVQNEDAMGAPDRPDSGLPHLPEPYTKDQVLGYASFLYDRLDEMLAVLDLAAEESGFPWYAMPKLDHQLVNLRHLQHHVGQLYDRLRILLGPGMPWVGRRGARS